MRSETNDRGPTLLLWSVAALLVLVQLGTEALRGSEVRWAEVCREMLLTGDYFHPTSNGLPYFDKPLLGYWLITLLAWPLGRLDEFLVRLPSALSGLVALAATMNLARRLGTPRQARTAGWLLLTSWGFLLFARTGEADAANLASIVLAVAWYWARRDRPSFVGYLVFFAICFLGAQTKGMAAIAVPLVAVLPDLLRKGRWRTHLSLRSFAALGCGIALYLAPLAYADWTRSGYEASGLWFAYRENVLRYFEPFDHAEPFYVYTYYLPAMAVPWVPLGLASIWCAIRAWRDSDWKGRWVTAACLFIFLFFTLSGSRRSYYILPLLPFCAILAARLYEARASGQLQRVALRAQEALLAFVALILLCGPVIWPLVKRHYGFEAPPHLVVITCVVGFLGLVPLLYERFRPGALTRLTGTEPGFGPPVVMAALLLLGFFGFMRPIFDEFRASKPFFLELKELVAGLDPQHIAYVEIDYFTDNKPTSAEMMFYMDLSGPTRILHTLDELREFLNADTGPRAIVARARFHAQIREVLPVDPDLVETIYPWRKHDLEKNAHAAWILESLPTETRQAPDHRGE